MFLLSFTTLPNCLVRLFVFAICITTVSACVLRDRSKDYRRSGSITPIVLPEEMKGISLDPIYPIPAVQKRDDAFYDAEEDGFDIPRPEPMSSEAEQTRVKIQRVGQQRWIVLEAPPSQVWPLSQSFLARNGVLVSRSQPATGLIETIGLASKTMMRIKVGFRYALKKAYALK